MQKITAEQLKSLKKGSLISGKTRSGGKLTLKVTSKLRTLKNGVGVVRMLNVDNPNGCKYSYYLRVGGYIGLSFGDMATSLDVEKIEI